jgi:peptide/nickel transport system permease protein
MAVSSETVAQLLGADRNPLRRRLAGAGHGLRAIGQRPAGGYGLITIGIVVALALFGAALAPQNPLSPSSLDFAHRMQGPSSAHWFGTDQAGRDLFSQFLVGARASLIVGVLAGIACAAIGAIVGICAGSLGGWADRGLRFVDDSFLLIPFIPFAVLLAVLLQDDADRFPGGRTGIIVLVLVVTGWPGTMRMVRARVLSLHERRFVERARSQGASRAWILRRHVLPNVLPIAWVNSVLLIALAMLGDAALSFFGLGAPGSFSWGTLLHNGFEAGAINQGAWWYVVPPGVAITLLVLAFVALGRSIGNASGSQAPPR